MFTVIDTPGFGNSEGQEMEYVDEMVEILKTTIKETNAVVLLLNAEEERLDYAFEQTISLWKKGHLLARTRKRPTIL